MKRVSYCMAMLIFILTLYGLIPQYEILSQHSFSSPEGRETVILAVSHTAYLGLYEVGEEIIRHHRRLNYDVPVNRITVRIYEVRSDVEEGKCRMIMTCEEAKRERDS